MRIQNSKLTIFVSCTFAEMPPGRQLLQGDRREDADVGISYRYHLPPRLARFQDRQLVLVSRGVGDRGNLVR
jgi:hypothetical protein